MKQLTVTMVRIYVTEKQHRMETILSHLHDKEKVRGVTVYRGITGFGQSGKIHSSQLLDLSFDLPLIIEFFDEPEQVNTIMQHLITIIPPAHMISWTAQIWVEN